MATPEERKLTNNFASDGTALANFSLMKRNSIGQVYITVAFCDISALSNIELMAITDHLRKRYRDSTSRKEADLLYSQIKKINREADRRLRIAMNRHEGGK